MTDDTALPTALLFLDTETTGLRPDIHAAWDVAWQLAWHTKDGRLIRDPMKQRFIHLPAATVMRDADHKALEIGRHAQRFRADEAITPNDLIREMATDITAAVGEGPKPHLVGAVPGFDHAMLARWFGWPGFGEGWWHYHLIDVEVLAAGRAGIAPPYDSSAISELFGVSIDDEARHTAAGDVDWALRLYAAVYDLRVIDAGERLAPALRRFIAGRMVPPSRVGELRLEGFRIDAGMAGITPDGLIVRLFEDEGDERIRIYITDRHGVSEHDTLEYSYTPTGQRLALAALTELFTD